MMCKICLLPGCGQLIPDTRKKSAKYCCEEHYYEAKVQRTNRKYHVMNEHLDKIKKNEKLLSALYYAQKFGAVISLKELSESGFNLGFSTGEFADDKGNIYKVIGDHAYYIDPKTKYVHIWKLK